MCLFLKTASLKVGFQPWSFSPTAVAKQLLCRIIMEQLDVIGAEANENVPC